MLVTKYIELDMGHRVPNHKSKCSNPHGHRYKIEIGVDDKVIDTKGISDEGMVIDFSDLKAIMVEKIDSVYDHAFTIHKDDELMLPFMTQLKERQFRINIVDFVPTAENLAKHWYELVKEPLKERGIKIKYCRVWETPTSTATYEIL